MCVCMCNAYCVDVYRLVHAIIANSCQIVVRSEGVCFLSTKICETSHVAGINMLKFFFITNLINKFVIEFSNTCHKIAAE